MRHMSYIYIYIYDSNRHFETNIPSNSNIQLYKLTIFELEISST